MESPAHTSISHPFWFIVPAAGIGRRFGGERPKQYLSLGDKTVIEQTLQKLLGFVHCRGVIVAISEEDQYWSQLEVASHPLIQKVVGGAERSHSVLNALESISDIAGENDWVLVHDAARPCVDEMHIAQMLSELDGHKVGGLLALRVADTIKQANVADEVEATLDRSRLWQAQTPQMFRYQLLSDSLKQALSVGVTITDEASAIEWRGMKPKLIEGSCRNLKITRPEDLQLAQFYLQQAKT